MPGRWKEADLFAWLKENEFSDLQLMEETYSKWDCITDVRESVIELKCRRAHYPTMLIEKKKYDAVVARAEELGYSPLYINSTPQGVFVWDLDTVDVEFKVEHKHPATTAFGNRQRVPKEVGYLDVENARKIK